MGVFNQREAQSSHVKIKGLVVLPNNQRDLRERLLHQLGDWLGPRRIERMIDQRLHPFDEALGVGEFAMRLERRLVNPS